MINCSKDDWTDRKMWLNFCVPQTREGSNNSCNASHTRIGEHADNKQYEKDRKHTDIPNGLQVAITISLHVLE